MRIVIDISNAQSPITDYDTGAVVGITTGVEIRTPLPTAIRDGYGNTYYYPVSDRHDLSLTACLSEHPARPATIPSSTTEEYRQIQP